MDFKIQKGELPLLNPRAIERAVEAFAREIDVHGDSIGFQNQTIKSIYHSVHDGSGDFWLAHENGEVVGYCLGRVGVDIDDRLTYWLSQAWVSPQTRGTHFVRAWLQQLKDHAKSRMCRHIVVISGRNGQEAAYCRFLGKGFSPYAVLLKQDI